MGRKKKKYRLINEEGGPEGLFRIQAIKQFPGVNYGDFGGYVQSEYNLSHDGTCWIEPSSRVFQHARVIDNARVGRFSMISGDAVIAEHAYVANACVTGKVTRICGMATVSSDSMYTMPICIDGGIISGYATIGGRASIYGILSENGKYEVPHISGNVTIIDDAYVEGGVTVFGNAILLSFANVRGHAKVGGNVIIDGGFVCDEAQIIGDCLIKSDAYISGSLIINSASSPIDGWYLHKYYSYNIESRDKDIGIIGVKRIVDKK